MQSYPNYFDQNQLYDLENDQFEQNSVNGQEGYYQVALAMKNTLQEHLSSFEHPFDLNEIEYMKSDNYHDQYQTNLNYDLNEIPWFRRDHGEFHWPRRAKQTDE